MGRGVFYSLLIAYACLEFVFSSAHVQLRTLKPLFVLVTAYPASHRVADGIPVVVSQGLSLKKPMICKRTMQGYMRV